MCQLEFTWGPYPWPQDPPLLAAIRENFLVSLALSGDVPAMPAGPHALAFPTKWLPGALPPSGELCYCWTTWQKALVDCQALGLESLQLP